MSLKAKRVYSVPNPTVCSSSSDISGSSADSEKSASGSLAQPKMGLVYDKALRPARMTLASQRALMAQLRMQGVR